MLTSKYWWKSKGAVADEMGDGLRPEGWVSEADFVPQQFSRVFICFNI